MNVQVICRQPKLNSTLAKEFYQHTKGLIVTSDLFLYGEIN